jgi:hypothetical protein
MRTLAALLAVLPLPAFAGEGFFNWEAPNVYMRSKRTTTGARNESGKQETWMNGRRMHTRMEDKDGSKDLYIEGGENPVIIMVNKGSGMRFDTSSPMFQQMRQSLPLSPTDGLKKTGSEKVAGRTCDVWEGERTMMIPLMAAGPMKQQVWTCLWKNVPLKSKHVAQGSTVETIVEEIKEGAASDSDLIVPAGIQVKDFKLPPGFGPPSTRPR